MTCGCPWSCWMQPYAPVPSPSPFQGPQLERRGSVSDGEASLGSAAAARFPSTRMSTGPPSSKNKCKATAPISLRRCSWTVNSVEPSASGLYLALKACSHGATCCADVLDEESRTLET